MAGQIVTAFGTFSPSALGAEQTVNTETIGPPGTYVYSVDFSALTVAAGQPDTVFCRLYRVILAGGSSKRMSSSTIAGVPAHPVKDTVPFAIGLGTAESGAITFDLTIEQMCGTLWTFPWKLIQIG